jgi:hypothetical protein
MPGSALTSMTNTLHVLSSLDWPTLTVGAVLGIIGTWALGRFQISAQRRRLRQQYGGLSRTYSNWRNGTEETGGTIRTTMQMVDKPMDQFLKAVCFPHQEDTWDPDITELDNPVARFVAQMRFDKAMGAERTVDSLDDTDSV